MKKLNTLLIFLATLMLISYYAYSQEEGFGETFVEETEGGFAEEGLPEETAPGEEVPFVEEAIPQEEIAAPAEAAPESEIPVVEEAVPPAEGAPAGEELAAPAEEAPAGEFVEEMPLEEIPLEEGAVAAPATPPPVPQAPPPVEGAPAVVTAPPAPPVTPQPPAKTALTEEESKAAPPPVTASMFPEPIPGTFIKRPAIVITAPFEYVVKEGDDLHFLAARFYGNARLWTKIYNANRKVLRNNPNSLTKGLRLVIPPAE
jgi:nucleoid-associated protein YgaU